MPPTFLNALLPAVTLVVGAFANAIHGADVDCHDPHQICEICSLPGGDGALAPAVPVIHAALLTTPYGRNPATAARCAGRVAFLIRAPPA